MSPNGNRTLVEIKDDNLTMESTTYEYDRLNKMIRSREVTADGLYIYEYKYDNNGNLIQEDRHRAYEYNTNQYQNIRRLEMCIDKTSINRHIFSIIVLNVVLKDNSIL